LDTRRCERQACGQNQAGDAGGELFDWRGCHGLGSFVATRWPGAPRPVESGRGALGRRVKTCGGICRPTARRGALKTQRRARRLSAGLRWPRCRGPT